MAGKLDSNVSSWPLSPNTSPRFVYLPDTPSRLQGPKPTISLSRTAGTQFHVPSLKRGTTGLSPAGATTSSPRGDRAATATARPRCGRAQSFPRSTTGTPEWGEGYTPLSHGLSTKRPIPIIRPRSGSQSLGRGCQSDCLSECDIRSWVIVLWRSPHVRSTCHPY